MVQQQHHCHTKSKALETKQGRAHYHFDVKDGCCVTHAWCSDEGTLFVPRLRNVQLLTAGLLYTLRTRVHSFAAAYVTKDSSGSSPSEELHKMSDAAVVRPCSYWLPVLYSHTCVTFEAQNTLLSVSLSIRPRKSIHYVK